MNIGLYFGSFNPIHIGHCIIANFIKNETPVDQVWFVVSPQNPFKKAGSLLNEYNRLHLVQKAIENNHSMRASDVEFHLERPSYTAYTLGHLREKYPAHRFAVIMGSDSYQNIDNWRNASYIKENFQLYVYLRPGFELTGAEAEQVSILKGAPLLEISATQIRQYIRDKKSIRYLVPEEVREEIERNGYYR
ncbi:MAG: nicotinate-nucleotide adenylyltransferase [Williamsia sp.]|nr:nicotinate-nucleotide adenylyltransferase [Williamsia sp.]